MFARLTTSTIKLGANRLGLFGQRFISDAASYDKCYKLIDNYLQSNPVFWGEIKETVQKVEYADKNNDSLKPKDLSTVSDLKFTLSRTYDPALFQSFEPLYSTFDKADNLFRKELSFSKK